MKRKFNDNDDDDEQVYKISKRIKIDDKININEWVSASSIHNYMLDDPILDWIKYSDKYRYEINNENFEDSFFKCIMEKGNKFEEAVIKYFKKTPNFSKNFKQISYCQEDICERKKFQETINAMKDGIPYIYQGVIHDNENNTFGSPDLIVRSDYINKLVPNTINNEDIFISAPNIDLNYHYRIIDIKYCLLHLCSDGEYLLNSGRMRANKGQIMLYNNIIGKIQGYTPSECYVLGRGWEFTKNKDTFSSDLCDNALGKINIIGKDKIFLEKINRAIKWVKEVKKNGNKWNIYPSPDRWELYPNMCNKYDMPYGCIKKKIAKELNEITQICHIGFKNRQNAHNNGIYSWKDLDITSETLGMNGEKISVLVEKILDFNNGKIGKHELVIPKIIENNIFNWKREKINSEKNRPILEFYLDFEIINNIFDNMKQIPKIGSNSWVFMIGLTAVINTENTDNPGDTENEDDKNYVKYYNFTAKELNRKGEYEIFNNMHILIKDLCNKYNIDIGNVNLYHWGHIEKNVYENILLKYNKPRHWDIGIFCDMLKLFKSEGILVKDVLTFGLKDIGKGLLKHNLITNKMCHWDDEVSNGLDAMIKAEKCYNDNNNDDNNNDNADNNILSNIDIQNIIKYNEIDCQMVYEIVNYLRNNHTKNRRDIDIDNNSIAHRIKKNRKIEKKIEKYR